MWKLENVTTYEEKPPIGKMKYDLMYPDEMELQRDPGDQNHFYIKPARDFYVKPAKFRQVESAVFVITNNERICLALSISESHLGHLISTTGLSTYTAEKYLPENFKEKQERLWKLKNVATYYNETISLTYPKEMELHPDPDDENHFGIRPVENVDVQPAKFRQVSTA